ncbi:MAG TPA: RES family NAD+ phosphorylase [Planctomycetota bacterium]|nr:RES family NAD+ phosphorylase [Planctomycetota bacterium]
MALDRAIPQAANGTPRRFVLREGAVLCRVHDCAYGATGFDPTLAPASGLGGGRFDATEEDRYGFLYAAGDEGTAVAETLLRGALWNDTGARHLPRRFVRGPCMSWIEPTRDLELVALRIGADLAALAQDSWLVTAPPSENANTRRWGHAIRRWAPWAAGFAWRSRAEPSGNAYVFFEDRVGGGAFRVREHAPLAQSANRLDEGIGALLLRRILEEYRVVIGARPDS